MPLLEKAYAQANHSGLMRDGTNSYEGLTSGNPGEAMLLSSGNAGDRCRASMASRSFPITSTWCSTTFESPPALHDLTERLAAHPFSGVAQDGRNRPST